MTTKSAELSNPSTGKGRDGERVQVGWSVDDNEGNAGTLMGIEVYPRIADDGVSVNVEIRPSEISTNTPIHPFLKAGQ